MRKSTGFWESLGFAAKGAVTTLKEERNARIDICFAAGALALAWFFDISQTEWLVLVLTIGLVLGAEIMNTAVEAAVDLCTEEYRPLAEKAKNAAAGAVLVTAVSALLVGLIIFGPRLFRLFFL